VFVINGQSWKSWGSGIDPNRYKMFLNLFVHPCFSKLPQ